MRVGICDSTAALFGSQLSLLFAPAESRDDARAMAVRPDGNMVGLRLQPPTPRMENTARLQPSEVLADRRWLARGRPPAGLTRDAFGVLLIAEFVSHLETVPENFGPLVTRLMFGSDPRTTLFRHVLLSNPVPEDEGLPWHDPAEGSRTVRVPSADGLRRRLSTRAC